MSIQTLRTENNHATKRATVLNLATKNNMKIVSHNRYLSKVWSATTGRDVQNVTNWPKPDNTECVVDSLWFQDESASVLLLQYRWYPFLFSAHITLFERTTAVTFLSVRPSVCSSVCVSVCQARGLWQNKIIICQYIPMLAMRLFAVMQTVEGVSKFVYLGLQQSSISRYRGLLRQIGIASSAMNSVQKVWRHQRLSIETEFRLYRVCILSILLYGSEC